MKYKITSYKDKINWGKNAFTSSDFEPMTVRFVTKCLNSYTSSCPRIYVCASLKYETTSYVHHGRLGYWDKFPSC
jgi:hypothetical protein